MSLLTPLFLLGALAIVGPIVAHLVRRNTRERVAFSATQFLEPSAPRLDRRNRVEHPWLLLLRVLAVLVLALGFARPFLRESSAALTPPASVRHRVIVLDASASMQRNGLWTAALDRARRSADELGSADALAVVVAEAAPTTLLAADTWARTPSGDRAAALDATLRDREPGWGATHLDTAVEHALEELTAMREIGPAPTETAITVISDFAEGARISGLAGREWPDGVRVELDSVARPGEPNASLHWLGWTEAPDGMRQARLRVGHEAFDTRTYQLTMRSADGSRTLVEPIHVILAPREARAVALPLTGDEPIAAQVALSGDTEPYDNTVWIVPPAPRQFTLPYWGAGDAVTPDDALYYITRASRGWREPAMTPAVVAPGSSETPAAPLHVVARALQANETEALRRQIEAGAFVLVLARDAVLATTAGELAGESGWTAAAEPVASDALLADIAFAHPLFSTFADPRYSDFTRVRFWRAPRIQPPANTRATVIARFDDESPAVLESAVGRGVVVVWAGDWTPAASQWVLSSKFVPWFHVLAQRSVGGPPAPTMAEVGVTAALRLPGGTDLPARPGVFTVQTGGAPRTVALNLPTVESRTAALPLDAWEALGVPLADATRTGKRDTAEYRRAGALAAARLEGEQRLWRWFLIGAAVLLALESTLAIRAASRQTGAPPTANPA